jgi:rhodanese-related sulfurtransferase
VTAQILFLGLIGAFLIFYVLRYLRTRTIQRYSPEEVQGKLKENEHLVLLDVRTEREHNFQHINGSLHIPLPQLRARVGELKGHRDKVIVCYCQSGNRSLSAARMLQQEGFRAASMRGGIVDWNFHLRSA